MYRRWYDLNPTLSMAISLLQNTQPAFRDKVVAYLKEVYAQEYPQLLSHEPSAGKPGWGFLQRRRSLNLDAWQTVELLRELSEADREKLAVEMIHLIYCLENNQYDEFAMASIERLEAII